MCSLLAVSTADAAKKKLLMKPKYDPEAPKVGLFEGMDQNAISVQVVAKNAMEGALLVENLTDQPLTVEMPQAIVGVQVLPQFGGGFGGGGMGGGMGGMGGGMGGMGGGMGGMGGGNQSFGGGGMGGMGGGMGGMGGGMGGMGGGMGGGGGFFSVPPETIARVTYQSVCLEHGKPEPRPKLTYKLIRPEDYQDNPALHELLKLVSAGQVDKTAAQAAAWHLSSKMSWQELAAKTIDHVNAPDEPYFHPRALYLAQAIVAESHKRAEAAASEQGERDHERPPLKGRVAQEVAR
ncbi:MAG: hypothetical protein ACK5Q5_07060 [Planctomycetaceae bacterium]